MRRTAWFPAVLLALPLTLAADVEDTEEMTFEVNSGARVSLENINGDITITGGPGDQVKVIARKKAGTKEYLDSLQIISNADADYVRIETRHPKQESRWFNWGSSGSGSVSYELNVPAHVNLDTIETVNGDVRIRDVGGAVKASTVNGGLDVENLAADVSLETVNGKITATFDVLAAGQRVDAEAVNGRIVIVLPPDASARVNAETVNGSIDANDFGLEAEKGFVGRDLSGEIGDGEARLSLDTVNGSITIRKK